MDACDGCCNLKKSDCNLREHKELCPCKNCIIKLKCKVECKEFVLFYRKYGTLYFDKVNNISLIGVEFAVPTKNEKIKIKRKKQREKY